MRHYRKFIGGPLFVVCCFISFQPTFSLPISAERAAQKNPTADQAPMAQPSDFVTDFPEIKWEMNFAEVKKAIEKAGAHPIGYKKAQTELAWDATYSGMTSRGTVLFKEDDGAMWEIAIIVYAMDKRQELFRAWEKKLVDKHGPPKEVQDTGIDTSKVWRLKNGFAIELRLLKDDNSPVIDLHWVKL